MPPLHKIRFLSLLLAIPFAANAQSTESGSEPSGWNVGIAVAARDQLYAGERGQTYVFPFVNYQGERFYWEGPTVGLRLIKLDHFTLSGFVAARGDGIDAEDFGRAELARHGINRDLLEDRDFSADAGVAATWKGAAGEFELDLRGDIGGVSDGFQASVDYRYPVTIGKVTLVPGVGASALSKDLANYYYGTLPEEVARGVVDYRPGEVVVPHLGIAAIVPFAERWMFISGVKVDILPNEISDSPLIQDDTEAAPAMFMAVTYGF